MPGTSNAGLDLPAMLLWDGESWRNGRYSRTCNYSTVHVLMTVLTGRLQYTVYKIIEWHGEVNRFDISSVYCRYGMCNFYIALPLPFTLSPPRHTCVLVGLKLGNSSSTTASASFLLCSSARLS